MGGEKMLDDISEKTWDEIGQEIKKNVYDCSVGISWTFACIARKWMVVGNISHYHYNITTFVVIQFFNRPVEDGWRNYLTK